MTCSVLYNEDYLITRTVTTLPFFFFYQPLIPNDRLLQSVRPIISSFPECLPLYFWVPVEDYVFEECSLDLPEPRLEQGPDVVDPVTVRYTRR